MKNILLQNGTYVSDIGQHKTDILIENGKISAFGDGPVNNSETKIIDCTNCLIFSGIIDAHTHMGIPIKDGSSTDDFASGSKSALNGGVTTIIDFTILGKNQSLKESVLERQKLAEKSVIDVALHCNITRFDKDILNEIPEIIKMGINSFKVFTTYKEAGMMLTYSQIKEVAKIIADNGGLLMVHAEDNDVIKKSSAPLISQNFTEPKYHAISRPAESEKVAVENIANIVEKTGCEAYIVHLNTADGLSIAKQCNNIFIETCPQYLLLDDSVYDREDGHMYVASPPLRKQEDCDALWQGIVDGSIDAIATDHCPFMLKDKPKGIPFQNIPNGVGGVETLFPIMLAQFIKRKIDLRKLVKLMCTNPSKIFGLNPQKNTIKIGNNADLVIVNPKSITKNWQNKLVSKTDWNAYSGFKAIFPESVITQKSIN